VHERISSYRLVVHPYVGAVVYVGDQNRRRLPSSATSTQCKKQFKLQDNHHRLFR
jgi:hypothetical protein